MAIEQAHHHDGEPAGALLPVLSHDDVSSNPENPVRSLLRAGATALGLYSPPRDPAECPVCGYDIRETPERCPRCRTVQVPPFSFEGLCAVMRVKRIGSPDDHDDVDYGPYRAYPAPREHHHHANRGVRSVPARPGQPNVNTQHLEHQIVELTGLVRQMHADMAHLAVAIKSMPRGGYAGGPVRMLRAGAPSQERNEVLAEIFQHNMNLRQSIAEAALTAPAQVPQGDGQAA